jgi:hypothetical protein
MILTSSQYDRRARGQAIMGDKFNFPVSQYRSQLIYIVLHSHIVQRSVMYKKGLSRPISLVLRSINQSGGGRKEKKTFEEGNIPFSDIQMLRRCKLQGKSKTMLARWQCEMVGQVVDPARMQKERTRKKGCAKTGYSALLYSTNWAVPVVVIVMHMSKFAFGFVSCFCSVISLQRLQFKIIRP